MVSRGGLTLGLWENPHTNNRNMEAKAGGA